MNPPAHNLFFIIFLWSKDALNSFSRLFDNGVGNKLYLWWLIVNGVDDALEEWYQRNRSFVSPFIFISWNFPEFVKFFFRLDPQANQNSPTSHHDHTPYLLTKIGCAQLEWHIWREIQDFLVVWGRSYLCLHYSNSFNLLRLLKVVELKFGIPNIDKGNTGGLSLLRGWVDYCHKEGRCERATRRSYPREHRSSTIRNLNLALQRLRMALLASLLS